MGMSGIRSKWHADGTLLTGDEWRAMAQESRRRSYESFERSDTDGYLSQWASDVVAREYDAWGDLADDGYQAEFTALFNVAGNLMDATEREGRFGWYWSVRTPGGTVFFNPSKAKKGSQRYANDTKKGFRLGRIRREAFVILDGGSYTSVSPHLRPVKDSEITVVDNAVVANDYYQDEE